MTLKRNHICLMIEENSNKTHGHSIETKNVSLPGAQKQLDVKEHFMSEFDVLKRTILPSVRAVDQKGVKKLLLVWKPRK